MDLSLAQNGRVANLLRTCSIELSPRDELTGRGLRGLFDPGTMVFVNNPPSVTHHDIIAACKRLAVAGFIAVPHVVARHLASYTQANDFLARLSGETGVTQILLLGGDAARPVGPFGSALEVLATGVVERHAIREVGFAGYPEGHPRIATAQLDASLRAKIELARARGLVVSLVTQFGFEAEPIWRWILAQRNGTEGGGGGAQRNGAQGEGSQENGRIACPVRIGVAGPASVATLAKYAVRCGIGTSLRALAHRQAAFARILTEADPGALIEALAARLDPADPIGLHIFCFGGARRTATWRRQMLTPVAI
jgi:methylenetetrahydrofolate reductase (NADPH)